MTEYTFTDWEYEVAYWQALLSEQRAAEWEAENYGDREVDRESLPYVTEDDLPLGEYEATHDLIGEYLSAYVNHHTY